MVDVVTLYQAATSYHLDMQWAAKWLRETFSLQNGEARPSTESLFGFLSCKPTFPFL